MRLLTCLHTYFPPAAPSCGIIKIFRDIKKTGLFRLFRIYNQRYIRRYA